MVCVEIAARIVLQEQHYNSSSAQEVPNQAPPKRLEVNLPGEAYVLCRPKP
jgi:hypothetical protein